MKRFVISFAALILLDTMFSAAGAVDIVTVPMGNLGNSGEASGSGPTSAIVGAVDYTCNIGKYEVTAGQYCEFLNAVAASDTYGLYDSSMNFNPFGCQITQNGSSGSYWYDFSGGEFEDPGSTAADWANRPVSHVSWGDAARFANWLHNGRPGIVTPVPQDLNSTEDGAYYLDGSTSDAALMTVVREADWKWAITNEDEWYKAAYHKNDGDTGNYYDYSTKSDSAPSNVLEDPDPGNHATFTPIGGDFTIGSPYYRTEVGAHENSQSPYGAFDQNGNVWEWNESVLSDLYRGVRGGSFLVDSIALHAVERGGWFVPTSKDMGIGFRVVNSFGPGDATGDGKVDVSDLGVLATNYGAGTGYGWSSGDFTGDSKVDVNDLGILATYYGSGSAVVTNAPEPDCIALLLGGLASLVLVRLR